MKSIGHIYVKISRYSQNYITGYFKILNYVQISLVRNAVWIIIYCISYLHFLYTIKSTFVIGYFYLLVIKSYIIKIIKKYK